MATRSAPRVSAKKTATGKPGTKTASTKVAKTAPARAASAVSPPAKNAKPSKADKPRKPKLVRDSFTIPKTEYSGLAALKKRAAAVGSPAKKSEVLRAGLMALAAMADDAFKRVLASVPTLKTGRPRKA